MLLVNGSQRKRQSALQTREAMLERGISVLSRHGLQPSLEELTIDSCLAELNIARSSAYNAWSEPSAGIMPQRRYQRAVLKRFVLQTPSETGLMPFEFARRLVNTDPSIQTREDLRRELNRLGAAEHEKNVARDRSMRVRTALLFTATTAPDEDLDHEMLEWFGQADQLRRDRLIDTAIRPVVEICGMRPRQALMGPAFWDQLSIAMSALCNGLFPYGTLPSKENVHSVILVGRDGVERTWTLMAIGLDALMVAFFENDPTVDTGLPSDPSRI